jgi:hypothetical protein
MWLDGGYAAYRATNPRANRRPDVRSDPERGAGDHSHPLDDGCFQSTGSRRIPKRWCRAVHARIGERPGDRGGSGDLQRSSRLLLEW